MNRTILKLEMLLSLTELLQALEVEEIIGDIIKILLEKEAHCNTLAMEVIKCSIPQLILILM